MYGAFIGDANEMIPFLPFGSADGVENKGPTTCLPSRKLVIKSPLTLSVSRPLESKALYRVLTFCIFIDNPSATPHTSTAAYIIADIIRPSSRLSVLSFNVSHTVFQITNGFS